MAINKWEKLVLELCKWSRSIIQGLSVLIMGILTLIAVIMIAVCFAVGVYFFCSILVALTNDEDPDTTDLAIDLDIPSHRRILPSEPPASFFQVAMTLAAIPATIGLVMTICSHKRMRGVVAKVFEYVTKLHTLISKIIRPVTELLVACTMMPLGICLAKLDIAVTGYAFPEQGLRT